ncbi:MAG: hypothetical protein GX592_12390 [Clostridiales bacterium]|nr:hypothetical protein [Clostridiales bacterium]
MTISIGAGFLMGYARLRLNPYFEGRPVLSGLGEGEYTTALRENFPIMPFDDRGWTIDANGQLAQVTYVARVSGDDPPDESFTTLAEALIEADDRGTATITLLADVQPWRRRTRPEPRYAGHRRYLCRNDSVLRGCPDHRPDRLA